MEHCFKTLGVDHTYKVTMATGNKTIYKDTNRTDLYRRMEEKNFLPFESKNSPNMSLRIKCSITIVKPFHKYCTTYQVRPLGYEDVLLFGFKFLF